MKPTNVLQGCLRWEDTPQSRWEWLWLRRYPQVGGYSIEKNLETNSYICGKCIPEVISELRTCLTSSVLLNNDSVLCVLLKKTLKGFCNYSVLLTPFPPSSPLLHSFLPLCLPLFCVLSGRFSCNPGWLWTHCAAEDGLELLHIHLPSWCCSFTPLPPYSWLHTRLHSASCAVSPCL